MLRLNASKFLELQGDRSESNMAKFIGISRSQLWRIKKGRSAVGGEFLSKFKRRYPNESLDDYFFESDVPQKKQRQKGVHNEKSADL